MASFKDADLSNKAGLEAFGAAFSKRVKQEDGLEKTLYYATFLETFFKDLCAEGESCFYRFSFLGTSAVFTAITHVCPSHSTSVMPFRSVVGFCDV